ncbi:hypothetical protein P7K49_039019 [Saguinus oedipus]|uniref:Uncharacterized protein n=1 Tax=Saguinus oedipus TaxID=9490 RepID=A0ABQ9TH71_SAGOE|nr:hypothetical protein P7K49_039019 [Saguinus oedipus]
MESEAAYVGTVRRCIGTEGRALILVAPQKGVKQQAINETERDQNPAHRGCAIKPFKLTCMLCESVAEKKLDEITFEYSQCCLGHKR